MQNTPRRRINLRELPYGLGYLIAAAVCFLVIAAAWRASRGSAAPDWWRHYIIPIIYWGSPLFLFLAIFFRIRGRRARKIEVDSVKK